MYRIIIYLWTDLLKLENVQTYNHFAFSPIDKCWASLIPNDISTTCKSRSLHAQVYMEQICNQKDNSYGFHER